MPEWLVQGYTWSLNLKGDLFRSSLESPSSSIIVTARFCFGHLLLQSMNLEMLSLFYFFEFFAPFLKLLIPTVPPPFLSILQDFVSVIYYHKARGVGHGGAKGAHAAPVWFE